ncbi:hypothetical protein JW868_04585 [Candidatus Woesearchaeota archaeon]|nr:hypothetical protein [Candidatus Woesearchaeota archaeon]
MAELEILSAVVMGLAISLVELFFVHADERGMGWLTHGLHAVPMTMLFTFITMNVPFALHVAGLDSLSGMAWVKHAVIVVVGIIAMVKVAGAAAIAGKVGEKKYHVLVIGVLIIIAPYAWDLVLKGLIGGLLPPINIG